MAYSILYIKLETERRIFQFGVFSSYRSFKFLRRAATDRLTSVLLVSVMTCESNVCSYSRGTLVIVSVLSVLITFLCYEGKVITLLGRLSINKYGGVEVNVHAFFTSRWK
jgi:hypothetical protein